MSTMTLKGSFIDHVLPEEYLSNTYITISLMLLGSFAIALAAQMKIYIPGNPIPITMQSLAVLIIGASYGIKKATGAIGLYLVEGALGIPVFAGGAAGISVLGGVTAGYLFGFFVAGIVMSYLSEKYFLDRDLKTALALFLIGHIIIFTFGVVWLSSFIGMNTAIDNGVLPFIPGMIIKTLLASIITPVMWKYFSCSKNKE